MRIAHVTISHGPFDVRVFHKECRTLAAAGHEVHLLVPGPVPPDRDGVRFHSLGDVGRETAYFWSVWRQLPKIFRQARDIDAAVYHLPDPSLIPLGLMLSRRGAKVVYDAHEDRPRQARTKYAARGQPVVGWVSSFVWRTLEAVAKARFDHFVAATPAIARKYPEKRTTRILNYPRLDEFSEDRLGSPPSFGSRRNDVVYAGAIHPFRGVRAAVEAIALLPEDLNCRLVLVGDFSRAGPGFREELEQLPGWKRVEYLGELGRPALVRRLARSRLGLNLLAPRPEHYEAMGNKTFEYMAAGLPVVVSDFPIWREVVAANGAGLTVDPRDPAKVASAIRYVLERPTEAEAMGQCAARAVASKYNWESEGARLVALYEALRSGPGPAGVSERPRRPWLPSPSRSARAYDSRPRGSD